MLENLIKKTIVTGLTALILGFNSCGSPPIAQMPDGNYREDAGIEQLFDGGDLEDGGSEYDAGISDDGDLDYDAGVPLDGGPADGGQNRDGGLRSDGGPVPDGGSRYDGGNVADGGSVIGEEGSPCYPNHTCNEGLSCYSNLCVRVPINDGGLLIDGGFLNDGGITRDGGLTLDAGVIEDGGIATPYTPDNHCIALFHFDNSINNDCMAVYNSIQSIGGQPQYQEGKFNSAIYFNGDQYLRGLGNVTLDLVNSLTVEAWIKPERTENSYKGAFGNIFHTTSSGIDPNNPGYYGFVLWVTNGRVNFTAGIEGQMYYLSAEAQLPTNRFTHIAATYDRGIAQIYVNRHLAIEGNTNGNLSRIPNSYVQFTLGADANNWNAFIGAIDELRVSNVAREF